MVGKHSYCCPLHFANQSLFREIVELNFTDTLQERFIQSDQSFNITWATLMATDASDIPLLLLEVIEFVK
jgi:hypothetical protein